MAAETFPSRGNCYPLGWTCLSRTHMAPSLHCRVFRASHSLEAQKKAHKELGLYSLRKKIDDIVSSTESITRTALELERAECMKREDMVRRYNLWDDPDKSNEILLALGDSVETVNFIEDLQLKVEEVSLISELVEMDEINSWLLKEAYDTSIDVSRSLDRYETSKLLTGHFDQEGACLTITSDPGNARSEVWAENLLNMYVKWAEKEGLRGRVTEKCSSNAAGIKFAIVEFEWRFAYGYLAGETGTHQMILRPFSDFNSFENSVATVDVIPIFLQTSSTVNITDEDLEITALFSCEEEQRICKMEQGVSILHTPTDVIVHSSGERSHFANKIKALNRLKAKLLLAADLLGLSDINSISGDAISDLLTQETRRYIFHPSKLVHDVKTDVQILDLAFVLQGNIEALLRAHIDLQRRRNMV